ncbi:MAG: dienelactone hydrolase family protein [Alphaproteobacteria bacterium]|nr:dienelactone hydrolase family protein [Alphaproteobacteria bacterium]
MNRITAKDFDQELLDLYDYYVHGKITKREFLDHAGRYAVGGVTAIALLNMLKPNYAMAEQVSFNDPDIKATFETYESPNGNGEDGKALQRTVDRTKLMNDFFAGYEHLAARPDSTGKVGVVGFCYGGGVCNALAVAYPELNASVPFYGRQAKAEDVPKIQAPLLIHYGELDKRINAGAPDYEAALKANGKTYEAHVYEGANHGFHNDSTPRYDEKMANLAWDRTIDWFNKYLT